MHKCNIYTTTTTTNNNNDDNNNKPTCPKGEKRILRSEADTN